MARQEERRRLQEILAQKKDESLKAMDVADIEKRLAELDASWSINKRIAGGFPPQFIKFIL